MTVPVITKAQTKPRIVSPSDRSTAYVDNQLNVTVSGNNIEVIYAGLTGNPNPYSDNESNFYKGTMYQSGNKFFFTPGSNWTNKWVKIIAHDMSSNLWSDPIYLQIQGVSPPSYNMPTQPTQTKPRITSPSDRSSSALGNDVNVYVSGSNIEVIYAGLTGNPNPNNDNESNFYKGTMYQSGNKFFFTPSTSSWENKWVKIIAHDKNSNLWSDPIYVKIQGVSTPSYNVPTQQQTKPRITSPKDRSDAYVGNQLNVTIEGNNIEVKYVGLNGSPNPSNINESNDGFFTGFMYQSGNKYYFTPSSAWSNKWVKIIAHDKNSNLWSDPIYVQIQGAATPIGDNNSPRGSYTVPIPTNGGILKYSSGDQLEIYIPVSTLKQTVINGRRGNFELPKLLPEGWATSIEKAADIVATYSQSIAVSVPDPAIGGGIATAGQIIKLVVSSALIYDKMLRPTVNGVSYFLSDKRLAEKIISYVDMYNSGYIIIPLNNFDLLFSGVRYTNETGVNAMNGQNMVSMDNINSSDAIKINKILSKFYLTFGSIQTQSTNTQSTIQSQTYNNTLAQQQDYNTQQNNQYYPTQGNYQQQGYNNYQNNQNYPSQNTYQQQQTKPYITSPSDRSSHILGKQLNVSVSGNNIEVIYAGLNGSPNPGSNNESNFFKGTMYSNGGNQFFFTPNTTNWADKWVKIIAHDKSSGQWSDPVYIKIPNEAPWANPNYNTPQQNPPQQPGYNTPQNYQQQPSYNSPQNYQQQPSYNNYQQQQQNTNYQNNQYNNGNSNNPQSTRTIIHGTRGGQ